MPRLESDLTTGKKEGRGKGRKAEFGPFLAIFHSPCRLTLEGCVHGIERRQGVRKGRLTPTLCNGEARDNAVGPLYTGCLYSYHVLRVIPTLIPDSEYSQNEAPGFWAPFQLSASSCGQTRCIKPRLFSPSNGELLTTISPVQVERSKFQRPKLTILEGSSFFLPPRSSLSAHPRGAPIMGESSLQSTSRMYWEKGSWSVSRVLSSSIPPVFFIFGEGEHVSIYM